MSFGKDSDIGSGFKKFVSEDELQEAREKRQEEWEKVRKPEDPIEAPEEVVDNRSLFDKLQEQKQAKDDEFADKHRLSSQVRGLDDGEAEFLDYVGEKQMEITRRREAEESEVLAELHSHRTISVVDPAPPVASSSRQQVKSSADGASKKSQASLLAGAVKRRSSDVDSNPDKKKAKHDCNSEELSPPEGATADTPTPLGGSTAQVIGILPGLGVYEDSSDSESSSDSEIELPPNLYENRKMIMAHTHCDGS